ncbi:DUF1844 domain-containing protein [bacterium]|nr:DUF1844 domain-containing protein [bacterium]
MTTSQPELEAQFSTLVISLASSSLIALGLEKNPQTNQTEKDLNVARFNIDLLNILKTKTNNNLTEDEKRLLDTIISDLQIKFCEVSK